MNTLVLFALPIATGVASVVWERIAATSRFAAAGSIATAYVIVMLTVSLVAAPGRSATSIDWLTLALHTALMTIVGLLWIFNLSRINIAVLGLSEAAYPLVVLVVSRILDGPTPLSRTTWIGAALVMVGAPLIAMGGR